MRNYKFWFVFYVLATIWFTWVAVKRADWMPGALAVMTAWNARDEAKRLGWI